VIKIACPKCGCKKTYDITLPDEEIHYGKRVCAECGRWLKWIKSPDKERFLYRQDNGDYKFVFGKYDGELLSEVILTKRGLSYVQWMMANDFPKKVHDAIEESAERGRDVGYDIEL